MLDNMLNEIDQPKSCLLHCKTGGRTLFKYAAPDRGTLKMARKKSLNGSSSKPVGKASVRRVPMRDFSRSLPMSLLRAREAVMRHFRPSLRDHGLTEQQWRILRALAAVDAIEVTELARVAFLLGPSLSRILRDLEARHLIDRKVAKADLRRGVVSISAKGLKLMEAVAPSSEAIYAAITGRYGARQLAALQEMLHALESGLSELRVSGAKPADVSRARSGPAFSMPSPR
jgi:homoprotocatechuate degradation regulator HpaR